MTEPRGEAQIEAMEWWESLSPKSRLEVIIEAFENSPNWGEYLRKIGTVDENGVFTPRSQ
jgi:hypothetical protein